MPVRRRMQRSGRRSFRPASDWGAFAAEGSLPSEVAQCDIYPMLDASDQPTGLAQQLTWLRVRGLLVCSFPSAETGLVGTLSFAWGIGLATAEALAVADAEGVPCPFTDAAWDGWLAHGYGFLPGTGDIFATNWPNLVQTIDSRAQRRVEDNVVYFAIEGDPLESRTLNYRFGLRFLVQPSSKR